MGSISSQFVTHGAEQSEPAIDTVVREFLNGHDIADDTVVQLPPDDRNRRIACLQ